MCIHTADKGQGSTSPQDPSRLLQKVFRICLSAAYKGRIYIFQFNMPLTKEKKAEILEELGGLLAKSNVLLLTNFSGISVEKIKSLRKDLREGDASYRVAKKSLLDIALKKAKVNMGDIDLKNMHGSLGVVFAQKEQIAPARAVHLFAKAKENKKAFALLGGVFDNIPVDAERLALLAKVQNREDLLAGLLRQIQAPVARLVYALDAIAKSK